MKRTLPLLLILALLAVLLSGCTAAGTSVSLPDVGVTFTAPEGWVVGAADQGAASSLVAANVMTEAELTQLFSENGCLFYGVEFTTADPAATAETPALLPVASYAIYTLEEIPALTTDDETVDLEKFNDAIISTLRETLGMTDKPVASAVINRHNGTYAFLQYDMGDNYVGYLVGMGGKAPYVIQVTTEPEAAFPMASLFALVDSIQLTK